MVGDWVYNKHHGKNIKLTQYDFFTQTNNDFGEQELVPFAKPTSGRDLEPIPLSVEILEKNGFEMVYDEYKLPNYRIKWKSYTNLFFTVFTGVDGYWNHVGLGVIIGGVPATLDYVHQLQHALRLCEIDKEIEL